MDHPLAVLSSNSSDTPPEPDPPLHSAPSSSQSNDASLPMECEFSFSFQGVSESIATPGIIGSLPALMPGSSEESRMTMTRASGKRDSSAILQPSDVIASQLPVDYTRSKVMLKEVDHSHQIRQSMYSLRSRCNRTIQELTLQKEAAISQMRLFQSEQKTLLGHLRTDMTVQQTISSQQEDNFIHGLSERDRTIALQAEAIKKLQLDVSSLSEKATQQAQAHVHSRDRTIAFQADAIKKLESNISALSEKAAEQVQAHIYTRDHTIARQADSIKKLQTDVSAISGKAAEQSQAHVHILAQKDSLIEQQAQLLGKLKEDIATMTESFRATAEAELSKQLQKIAAEKESELLAVKQKNEDIVQQLRQLQEAHLQQRSTHRPIPVITPLHPVQQPTSRFSVSGDSGDSVHHPSPEVNCPPGDVNAEQIAQQVYSLLVKNSHKSFASSSSPPPQGRRTRVPRKVQELKREIDTDTERSLNLEHVRHVFEVVFQFTKDEDYLLATGPSQEELKLFADTGSNGPDPFELCWDFDHPASSDWNQVVISMIVRKLADLREEEHWTTTPRSHAYWVEAITQKFNRIRTVVSKAKPRVLDGHSAETANQAADRLIRAKDESLKKARRDSRRMMKYQRRLQGTKTTSQIVEESGLNDDARAWRFLHEVVMTLGGDGMSSDESGEEDMQPVFFTSLMPWRRDITKELKIIDTSRSPQTRGSKAAKRIKSTTVTSRKAAKGLPPQLYDPIWLANNKTIASEESFQWLELITRQT